LPRSVPIRPTPIGCWNSRPEWDVRQASSSSSAWVQDRRRTENANSGPHAQRQMRRLEGGGVSGHATHLGNRARNRRALGQMYDQHRIRVKRANSLRAAFGCPPPPSIKPKSTGKVGIRSLATSQQHSGPPRKTPRSGHFDHHPARRLILRALTNCQDECA
jgi:hypothetical protein